jgi:hypothetical protein
MPESITIVDAHVHVHPTTHLGALLDAAARNLEAAASRVGVRHWNGVLMLAEMCGVNWFDSIGDTLPQPPHWQLQSLPDDPISAQAVSGDYVLSIVAGRQVVTAEGIEVLTLGTRSTIPDKLSLTDTLAAAARTKALVVLPWGAGKWLGARGRLVKETLDRHSQPPLFAGDNGGRPVFWPEPDVFTVARNKGRPVISGTDPLPLVTEEQRVGSFGFWVDGAVSTQAPGQELCEKITVADPASVHAFGHLQSPLRFVRNQVALRMNKKK